MRRTEQCLAEGLQFAALLFELRTEHVGENVTVQLTHGVSRVREFVLQSASLGVTFEVSPDAEHRREVVDEAAATATAEDVEAGNRSEVGVYVDERKADRDFNLRNILRDADQGRRQCEQHN